MNIPHSISYTFDDLMPYKELLQKGNPSGIFSMDWLRQKQDTLPNKWIMQPIIARMIVIWIRLKEVYKKDIDPITWLAWCYYDQWHSCNTISNMLADMGIEYKKWSLSQFTMKQCNWIKRPHTHITEEGIGTLRKIALTRKRTNDLLEG